MMNTVTVITPAYNAEKTIANTIKSVQNQTFKDWEMLIVNDGSQDNTESICRKFANEDNRIKVFSIENSGVSAARNYAINKAKGRFIAFIDSDDEYKTDYIEIMVSTSKKYAAQLVCCCYSTSSGDGKSSTPYGLNEGCFSSDNYNQAIFNMMENKCFNVLWNKLFIADIIKQNNLIMDTSVSMGEDLLFVIDYFKYMSGNLVTINKALYKYTISSGGLQASTKTNNYERRVEQWKKLFDLYTELGYNTEELNYELTRIMYISVLEADKKNLRNIVKKIVSSDEFKALKNSNISGIKNKIMVNIFSTGNIGLISFMVKTFACIKNIQGKRIVWK